MEPQPDSPNTFAQRLTRGFLALVFLVVLYVLSMGPSAGFFYSKFVTLTLLPDGSYLQTVDGPLAQFYAPVSNIAMGTGLSPALHIYCGWWTRIADHCYGKY